MFAWIPVDVYPLLYQYSTPRELAQLQRVSREQSTCVARYVKDKHPCPLCKSDWVSTECIRHDRIFMDTTDPEVIQRRLEDMSPYHRTHLLCGSCESIPWTRRQLVKEQYMKITDQYPYFDILSPKGVCITDTNEVLRLFYMTETSILGNYHMNLCMGSHPWVVLYRYEEGILTWNAMTFFIQDNELFLPLYEMDQPT